MLRLISHDVAAWCGGTWSGPAPSGFTAVSTDSRHMTPGALYIALKGERFDGHDFVGAALQAGAAAALVENGFARGPDAAVLLHVADTHRALVDVARGVRNRVSPRLIGITGSVGKSTVKELVTAMLTTMAPTACTRGNWNNDIGLPLSLLAMPSDATFGVFELGTNHPGEIAGLCELLRPEWGMVTNIGASHLEHFGSEAAVADEKGDLLAGLPADGVAFLDRDGAFFDVLQARTSARVVSVGIDRAADIWSPADTATAASIMVEDRRAGETFALPRVLPGIHQVRNLLLAVAVAREAGVSWEGIRAGIEAFEPMPMRWTHEDVGGVRVINDAYNANPLSMNAALDTFRDLPVEGGRWLALGDMLELGDAAAEAHRVLGRRVAEGNWAGLVTVGALAAGIGAAAQAAGWRGGMAHCATAAEAGAWLCGRLERGDALLLKGSRGMHLESIVSLIGEARKGTLDGC